MLTNASRQPLVGVVSIYCCFEKQQKGFVLSGVHRKTARITSTTSSGDPWMLEATAQPESRGGGVGGPGEPVYLNTRQLRGQLLSTPVAHTTQNLRLAVQAAPFHPAQQGGKEKRRRLCFRVGWEKRRWQLYLAAEVQFFPPLLRKACRSERGGRGQLLVSGSALICGRSFKQGLLSHYLVAGKYSNPS